MSSDYDGHRPESQPREEPHAPPPGETKPPRRIRIGRFLLILLATALVVAADGVISRRHSDAELEHWTRERAIPTVAVVAPKGGVGTSPLILPGDIEAWYNAPIHAQVSGYVRSWKKDIGARVKTGDVLAEIDTPELDERIAQAGEELSKAKANRAFAETTAKRWQALRNSDAVSQQATDEKESDKTARDADVAAAEDNLDRLRALKGFANIVAPFDGVVTARNVDVGALVTTGGGAGSSLFTVADIHEMRVYVSVPQVYTARLRIGMTATLKLPQYADRTFAAAIATTSNAIAQKSRSLLVELSAKNDDGALMPGAFAQVVFDLPADPNALRLPASALLFRDDGATVATVGADDRIALKRVSIARDFGDELEIASGVSASDRVVASPYDSIENGDVVKIKPEAESTASAKASKESAE